MLLFKQLLRVDSNKKLVATKTRFRLLYTNSVDNIFHEQQSCDIKHAFPLIISLRQAA